MGCFARCVFSERTFNVNVSARQLRAKLTEEYFLKARNSTKSERIRLREEYRIAFDHIGEYCDCYKEPPHFVGTLHQRRFVTDAWTQSKQTEKPSFIKKMLSWSGEYMTTAQKLALLRGEEKKESDD